MKATRRILAINAGSSSLRYRLVQMPEERTLREDRVERLDSLSEHRVAVEKILDHLATERIDAIGHRIVHGAGFERATIIDDSLLTRLEELSELAPLHNPPAIAGIRAACHMLPLVPSIAVFDTSFHASLPAYARTYALDVKLAEKYGIRRYGFHGISYAFVCSEAARILGLPLKKLRMIVLHLGNGASAVAIRGGVSVDTSMGFTPVEGLVMGTRPGDLDPSIVTHLQRVAGLSLDDVDGLLNRGSGLLGLTGLSDMRDVLDAAVPGSAAELAVEIYLHRLRHYIGAYAAELDGVDALVFTGGVGENSALIRERTVERLGFLGARIDDGANRQRGGGPRIISPPDDPVRVLVIPTDEELEITRQTDAVIAGA